MSLFVLNIFLAMVWTFLQGELRASSFLVGFVLGYFIIGLSQTVLGSRGYALKVVQVARFVTFVAWGIFTASLKLAWMILHPRLPLRSGIVAVPLKVSTDLEIFTLANLIGLSPGTLALDISDDRSTLYVHTVTLESRELFCQEVNSGLERRVLEVMR